MSLSNPSQLLLRNEELLESNFPLVVGCPDNEFLAQLITHCPEAEIANYQVNYAHFAASESRYQQINNQYSACYERQVSQQHDLAIIYFPKSKAEYQFLLAMITPTLATDAKILVVGENKGGVKSAQKLANEHICQGQKVDSARHCTLFSFTFNNQAKAFKLEKWYKQFAINVAGIELQIASLPGVFSSGELDHGTRLLLENLPASMKGKVLDFGCGAGIIGAFIKKKFPKSHVDLLDVNALAIESAKHTLSLNNLEGNVFASDGLSEVKQTYQSVVSNPPFHQGIKTNYHTTETFLKDIKKFIAKQGSITIVANNFLRYAPILKAEIGVPSLLAHTKGFSVHFCNKQ